MFIITGQLKLKQNLHHIWEDMNYYRPPFDIFWGGDVSPCPPRDLRPWSSKQYLSEEDLLATSITIYCLHVH